MRKPETVSGEIFWDGFPQSGRMEVSAMLTRIDEHEVYKLRCKSVCLRVSSMRNAGSGNELQASEVADSRSRNEKCAVPEHLQGPPNNGPAPRSPSAVLGSLQSPDWKPSLHPKPTPSTEGLHFASDSHRI